MKEDPKQIFENLHNDAKTDSNIIGFYLSGSRGKNKPTIHSDYDVVIIVKDYVLTKYKEKYEVLNENKMFDIAVATFKELEEYGTANNSEQWDMYSFCHVKALVDKNGKIQETIDKKSRIPSNILKEYISGRLDAYINYAYRSIKCFRDGYISGARLEAAYSIPYFFDVIFAIHDGRYRPFYKYLEWELNEFPLDKIPLSANQIMDVTLKILESADLELQQKLLIMLEKVLRKEGYGKGFDSWPDWEWMISFCG